MLWRYRPLTEAIKEQNLDENKIIGLLNERYEEFIEKNEEFTDWVKEKPSKLIDYIVNTHHAYLNEEFLFPIIKAYEEDKTNGSKEKVLNLLNELEEDIFQHIHLENNILFKNI